jgi:hypothetical protein
MRMQHPGGFENDSRFSSGEAASFFRVRIFATTIVGAPDVAAFSAFVYPIQRPLFRNRSTEPVQRRGDATTRRIRTGPWGNGRHSRGEKRMEEKTRRARELDALESIAAELERLRMLKEYELRVRVQEVEGDLWVEPDER